MILSYFIFFPWQNEMMIDIIKLIAYGDILVFMLFSYFIINRTGMNYGRRNKISYVGAIILLNIVSWLIFYWYIAIVLGAVTFVIMNKSFLYGCKVELLCKERKINADSRSLFGMSLGKNDWSKEEKYFINQGIKRIEDQDIKKAGFHISKGYYFLGIAISLCIIVILNLLGGEYEIFPKF